MAHNALIKGVCPKCGEMLEIPGHLKQFSCLYCGARLSPAEILAELAGPVSTPAVDGETAYRFYCDHILEAIVNYPGIERQLTKGEFDPAFQRYSSGIGETFRMLNAAVSAGTAAEDQAAAEFLDQLETHWRSLSKWSLPINRSGIMETDKFVIAIFLVPAVRRMALPCSETFCVALREEWARRHPKSSFNLGDYDSIVAGFRKKYFGLCFITTAVCRGTGKANDCEELNAFRNFRDGYLRSCPDGPALIDEYYDIAPGIVLRLDLSPDRDRRYEDLRQEYLLPCYRDLQAGRLAQCKERYVEMVRSLEQEFLH